jgi:hypothetical protein
VYIRYSVIIIIKMRPPNLSGMERNYLVLRQVPDEGKNNRLRLSWALTITWCRARWLMRVKTRGFLLHLGLNYRWLLIDGDSVDL